MTRLACDGPTLIRSVAAAVANLERHVAEVDALNVFPVPDGDTGSNMLATMRAALVEAEGLAPDERDLGPVAAALGRGALRGARGNSGVILAQIVRGMTDSIDGRRRATGADLAAGLRRGAVAAYGSVASPVEGTILTVIRDAAAAAEAAAERARHVETVLDVAIEAANWSVARTPTLLPILAETGVVDSGGQGLLRLLEGTRQLDGDDAGSGRWSTADTPAPMGVHPPAPDADRYGYETVFLIDSPDGALDLEALRHELGTVGDSVVVAGDRSAARVHVHGANPDLAVAIGLRAGRLSDIAIVDLDAETAGPSHHPSADVSTGLAPARPRSLALVVLAAADGTAALVASLGASVARSPSGIAEAVAGAGAEHVLLLVAGDDGPSAPPVGTPPTTRMVARDVGALVAAALAFDPVATPEANVARMTSEAERVRTFAVEHESEPAEATLAGLRAHRGDGFELVTLYAGPGVDGDHVEAVRAAIAADWPSVEIDTVMAGETLHALVVALD